MFNNKLDTEFCSNVTEFCKKLEDAVAQYGIVKCKPWGWELFIGFEHPDGNYALHATEISDHFEKDFEEAQVLMLTLIGKTIRAGTIRFESVS